MQQSPQISSPSPSPSASPSSSSPQKRKTLLMQLIRKKRERDAEEMLGELATIPDYQDLITAIKHNQFGGFCLQADDLTKAATHFTKALETVQGKYGVLFTNVYMNLGNLYGQKKDYHQAITHYQKVLSQSPHSPTFQQSLSQPQLQCRLPQKYSNIIYSTKLNSQVAYLDAHTNLAVMYIQVDQIDKAFQYCQKSLEMDANNSESIVNFTDILRQLGRKQEAITRTWQQIVQFTRKDHPDYEGFTPIQIQPWKPSTQQQKQPQTQAQLQTPTQPQQPSQLPNKISILTVKWGTRYPPAYVNKLYSCIKKHTSWQIEFYCFTDDSTGLAEGIKIMHLEEGWKKWWGKVTLFRDWGIQGRKFYIDLDMIVTGDLDGLFAYAGQFAVLRSGDLECEKNHKEGYNSSIMIWNSNTLLTPVYTALQTNFQNINKCIVRFDFWLEMTIQNADYIQVMYPGQVVDFLRDAKETLPKDARVVCFARKPKPEDYPAEWVKQYWVE